MAWPSTRSLLLPIVAAVSCRTATSQANQAALDGPVTQRIAAVFARDEARLIAVRRDLHRHPEVSGQEQRTAGIVAAELRRLGLDVRTGIGGFGVVGLLRGARPGATIAYRADMDAVPSTATDPVDFASVNAGVRHICGHDVHTTVGLALAAMLSAVRDSLSGSVMFIFQPAEERATGARAMLDAGVFSALAPSEVYGVHTSPYEVGQIATRGGPLMAGRDRYSVTIDGSGDLAAVTTVILQRIIALGTITPAQAFSSQPFDVVLVQPSPTRVEAGRVTLEGVVSIASPDARSRVQEAIQGGLGGSPTAGVVVRGSYEPRFIAGVTNDAALASRAATTIAQVIGTGAMREVTGVVPAFSEDFGSFQERVPGVFFFLGVANSSRGWGGMPHSPDYVADEKAIGIGARAMAAVLLDRLHRP